MNQVGGQDELIFDGSSFVTDSAGDLIAQLPQFEEALQIVDLEVGARPIGELSLIRVSEPKKTKKPIPEPTVTPGQDETGESGMPWFSNPRLRGKKVQASSNRSIRWSRF